MDAEPKRYLRFTPDHPECMPLLWYIDSPDGRDQGLASGLVPLFSPALIADLEAWVDVWVENDEFEEQGMGFDKWVERGQVLFEQVRTVVEPEGYTVIAKLE
jgi:hypothetical protein